MDQVINRNFALSVKDYCTRHQLNLVFPIDIDIDSTQRDTLWIKLEPLIGFCKTLLDEPIWDQRNQNRLHIRQFGRLILQAQFNDSVFANPITPEEGILSLPHYYAKLVHGQDVGVIKVERVGQALFHVFENTPFPEDFYIGYITQYLVLLGGKGIRTVLSYEKKTAEPYFSLYKVTWIYSPTQR